MKDLPPSCRAMACLVLFYAAMAAMLALATLHAVRAGEHLGIVLVMALVTLASTFAGLWSLRVLVRALRGAGAVTRPPPGRGSARRVWKSRSR